MSRYRKQQGPGDNLRDLYAKVQQWISSGLGDSSIDWDDSGDDLSSLDITVSDATVAKYGHDGSRHGFLVPNGGGWQTVQEDATAKADAAEAAANAHANSLNSAMDSRMDTAESDINSLQASRTSMLGRISGTESDISDILNRLDLIESHLDM